MVSSLFDADPNVRREHHHSVISCFSPPSRSQDRSSLKYVAFASPNCVAQQIGVWSDSGRGRDVTSAKGKASRSSVVQRNRSSRDWVVGPLRVNHRSDGPISVMPRDAITSLNWLDPRSRPPPPFGRSFAIIVTLKSPPMRMGLSG